MLPTLRRPWVDEGERKEHRRRARTTVPFVPFVIAVGPRAANEFTAATRNMINHVMGLGNMFEHVLSTRPGIQPGPVCLGRHIPRHGIGRCQAPQLPPQFMPFVRLVIFVITVRSRAASEFTAATRNMINHVMGLGNVFEHVLCTRSGIHPRPVWLGRHIPRHGIGRCQAPQLPPQFVPFARLVIFVITVRSRCSPCSRESSSPSRAPSPSDRSGRAARRCCTSSTGQPHPTHRRHKRDPTCRRCSPAPR